MRRNYQVRDEEMIKALVEVVETVQGHQCRPLSWLGPVIAIGNLNAENIESGWLYRFYCCEGTNL